MASRQHAQSLLFPPETDEPISLSSSSTFAPNMALPVHRWFRYSAGFSAEWVKSVIESTPGARVFDPFAGSATGFSEDVYDRAMQVGLRLAEIGYEGQKVVELKYKDHYVGEGYPDLVVHLGNDKLIVELKAISGELGASEEQQLRNYLRILNITHGLLINFQQPGKKQGKTKLDVRDVTV